VDRIDPRLLRGLLGAAEDASPVEAAEAITRALGAAPGARTVSFLIADLSRRGLVRLAHVPFDDDGGSRNGDEVATSGALYSTTKFAVRGLALNLQQEVAGHPRIRVCLVLPGPVDTPFFDRAANHTGHRLRAIPPASAPERVAATILACARRPRRQATTGVVPHLALAAHRLAPRRPSRLSPDGARCF